jgi:DNA-binding transcriptional regulator LsrR (DeoR family)
VARLDELRLMTRVARLYYDDGVRQPEIARRLRLSQPKVSRLLKQAHEAGIVRISVRPPSGTNPELERALEGSYGLHQVEVVEVSRDDDEAAVREIGAAAAYHLETTVRSGDVIGVSSWSATLLAMVEAMHPVAGVKGTQVVQILGGGGDPAAEGHATHLVRRMAHLLHGEGTFLPAPSSVGSKASRDVLLADPFVRRAMALFDDLDVALVGIGGQEPSGLLTSSGNVFSRDELQTVRAAGGIGDIGLRFLREDGEPVRSSLDERVIGIDLPQLKRVPRAIGVAGGPGKTKAIRAALVGGWINCLITDRFSGERLLELSPQAASPALLTVADGKSSQSREASTQLAGAVVA